MSKNKISVIVRAFNEAKWLSLTLNAVFNQTSDVHEVIVVDSGSTDGSKEIVKLMFPQVMIVDYEGDKYFPGKAINQGIQQSTGNLVSVLSAHCVPVHDHWLDRLEKSLLAEGDDCAGVYSRQVPLKFSSNQAIRDLSIMYSSESRVQYKDPYFNNASSLFRRSHWEELPFEDNVTNLEDRLWAAMKQRQGCFIKYCAESLVYHHHGPHHENNEERLNGTRKVLCESYEELGLLEGSLGVTKKDVIPIYLTKKQQLDADELERINALQNVYGQLVLLAPYDFAIAKELKDRIVFIPRKEEEVHRNNHVEESIKYYSSSIAEVVSSFEYLLICDSIYGEIKSIDPDRYLNLINHNHYDIIYPVEHVIEPVVKWDASQKAFIRVDDGNLPVDEMKNTYIVHRGVGTAIHISRLFLPNVLSGKIGIVEIG